jgi:hypothetical protein
MDVIGFLCVSLGSSTVQLHDSLDSKHAFIYSEAGFGSENEVYTTEKQRSVLRFCGQKDWMQRIFIKKHFLFKVGTLFQIKRFHLGSECFVDDEEVEAEMWKWLRQQSKDFYAAGFDALVKQWDECINVGGGYVEK